MVCLNVEYHCSDEATRVYFTQRGTLTWVRLREGRVTLIRWGARSARHRLEHHTGPGHMRTRADGGWTTLDEIRTEKWRRSDPTPVKIVISFPRH